MVDTRSATITFPIGDYVDIRVAYSEQCWCWEARTRNSRASDQRSDLNATAPSGSTPFEAIAKVASAVVRADDEPSHGSTRNRSVTARIRDFRFAVGAGYDERLWGWVANVGVIGDNDRMWQPWAESPESKRAFTNPYDCIGNAVAFAAATAEGLDYDPFSEDALETRGVARRLFSRSDLYTLGMRE